MSTELILLITFAASQVGTPGPANMALLATGARYGFKSALPFVSGVALGKQFLIWPLGLGMAGLATASPVVFETMRWLAAAYMCWLAWKIAGLTLRPGDPKDKPPGFLNGLVVHPLNPKAWAIIIASFTNFTDPAAGAFASTARVAAVLFGCQIILHPLWTYGGQQIASMLAGSPFETYLMKTLAVITVASVALVLFTGDTP